MTADPGVTSWIPARFHTLMEIDNEIISTVILFPSADSLRKGCCQFQAKVCGTVHAVMVDRLFKLAQETTYITALCSFHLKGTTNEINGTVESLYNTPRCNTDLDMT